MRGERPFVSERAFCLWLVGELWMVVSKGALVCRRLKVVWKLNKQSKFEECLVS